MRKAERERIDPNQPALVVTYGNTAKKYRPLDADVIVLGRSPRCDVNLVAPDVAPVHCVLAWGTDGWRLRDCSGRPGTRVNGRIVHEARLDDGDIIQVGVFSFQVRLPSGGGRGRRDAPVQPSLVSRLRRARRNLIRLALALRKRLGDRLHTTRELEARRDELIRQSEALRTHQRDYELRMTRLELSERDLATDRATLDKEYRALQEDVQRHAAAVRLFEERVAVREKELEERRAALHAETAELWRQWQQRDQGGKPPAPSEQARQASERARELDRRVEELGRLVGELRQVLREARVTG